MNFRTTLILFVLVVVGIFLWIYSGKSPAETADTAAPQAPLKTEYVFQPKLENKDILGLEIQHGDKPSLSFVRAVNPDNPSDLMPWCMTSPIECNAEPGMVSGLTTMAEGLQYKRSFKPGQGEITAAEAGLEPPQAKIKIVEKGGQEHVLEIGKPVPLSNDTYIRIAGRDDILITSRPLSNDLERKAEDYRVKNVLSFAVADVQHVRIEHENQPLDLTRGAGKDWLINEPIKAYANPDIVKKLLEAVSRMRFVEFADDHPASLEAFGLVQPAFSITINTEHTEEVKSNVVGPESQPSEPTFKTVVETHTLLIGGPADLKSAKCYAKLADKPWIGVLPQSGFERMIPKLAELRDPKITRIKADEAAAIELAAGGQTAVLTKRDGLWRGDGDLSDLEDAAVQKLLQAIEDAAAIDFIDQPQAGEDYGLDAPRAVLKITAENQIQPLVLKIGKNTPSGHNTYAQIDGRDSVLVISATLADELAVDPISLRSCTITSLPPEGVRHITITHSDRRYDLQRKAEGAGWDMLEPADVPPDAGAIRALATDLARLRAKQVAAKDADAAYGLDAPEITVEFEAQQDYEGPPATDTQPAPSSVETVAHTLRVARHGEGIYAKFDDLPYVFELDQTVYGVIAGEFIQPALFSIRSENVVNVKIESPSGTLEFARVEKEWSYPPDPYLKLAQPKVNELVKGLAELRVAGYVAYRDAALADYGLDKAPLTVTIRLKDESTITLKIDETRPADDSACKAAWLEQQRIFLLPYAEVEKLLRGLDEYLPSETPTPEKGG